MANFRIGLVGCGKMMLGHARALHTMEGVEVTAFCDIIPEQTEYFAKEVNPSAYQTTDWKTMVDHVDGILCALPHDLHYECGVFFARNHKHILMEKPIANSEEECVRLCEICDEEGVILMCGYPVRHYPTIQKTKELLDSGKFGKVIQCSIWTEQLTGINYDEGFWAATARIGGGQLFSHGCHYIDILLYLLGEPVSGSHIGTQNGTPWMMKEGTSVVTMKFKNGAIGYHTATWGARGTKLYYSFQIHTEKGMLDVDIKNDRITLYDGNREHVPGEEGASQGVRILWEAEKEGILRRNTIDELSYFVNSCTKGTPLIADGWSSIQSLRVIWKLYEAEEQRRVADLRGLGLQHAKEYTYKNEF